MDCNECVSWPCPDLSCCPCLPGFTSEQFENLLECANEIFFEESGNRFNGDQCLAVVSPCLPCACPLACGCDPCRVDRIDLCKVGLPVHEVVSVTIDGEEVDASEWMIQECRYLMCPPGGWPMQNFEQNGGRSSWSVTVRYGKKPPKGLLRMRDQWLFEELQKCVGGGSGCNVDIVSANVKGVEYQTRKKNWEKAARTKYGCRKDRVGYWPRKERRNVTPAQLFIEYLPAEDFCDVPALIEAWIEQSNQEPVIPLVDPVELDEFGLPVA